MGNVFANIKNKARRIATLVLFLSANLCFAQCPLEGNAKTEKEKQLNRLKNREVVNRKVTSIKITIDSLLKSGNDTARFKSTDYVSITGYVISVSDGGAESCNCGSGNKSDHDVHIYIGKTKDAKKSECFVAEVTPAFKKANPAFNYKGLTGAKVKVKGWMLFDYEHKGNAKNTCKKCTDVWRQTSWEIHPVCKIEITK